MTTQKINKKNKLFTMKISEEEKEWLEELAHYRGHSIASYLMSLVTEDSQKVMVRIPKEAWKRNSHKFTSANKEFNFYLSHEGKEKVYTSDGNNEEGAI